MSFSSFLTGLLCRTTGFLPRSNALEAVARSYSNRFHGENSMEPEKNGEYAVLRAIAPGLRTIIDVGANRGDWAAEALRLAPKTELRLFEPNPQLVDKLRSRFSAVQNLQITAVALGDEISTRNLIVFEGADEVGSFHTLEGVRIDAAGIPKKIEVCCSTLDTAFGTAVIASPCLLKLDVEGHELAVLRGGQNLLAGGAIDYVQFEYHATWIYSRSFLRDVFELLGPHYRFYKILGDGGLLSITRYTQDIERFQYSNYLCIHRNARSPDLPVTELNITV
jgi:FkbM family methyltransferase